MIYWLVNWLGDGYFTRSGLGLRIAAAGVVSFFIVMFFGERFVRFLVRKKIGDRPDFDHEELNQLNRHNSNTPTMGGGLIVGSIFISLALFANLQNMYIVSAMMTLVWLGVLGGIDDWMKLKHSSGRDGLRSWEKFLFQVALAVLLSVFVYKYGSASSVRAGHNPAHEFFLPVGGWSFNLPLLAYMIIMTVVMVGSSNAVNLTDGMDGLATGNLLIVTVVFLVISWVVGVVKWADIFNLPFVPFSAEMTVICSAMLGALLGFLWFNASPAAVYMGDTGSLPLGGLIGYIAVITRQEILLLLAGGVFVMEAGSVILQVGYYKWTKPKGGGQGKRIFRCAPIHHHFHLLGWPSEKVVVRFWILGIIFAVLALASLKFR